MRLCFLMTDWSPGLFMAVSTLEYHRFQKSSSQQAGSSSLLLRVRLVLTYSITWTGRRGAGKHPLQDPVPWRLQAGAVQEKLLEGFSLGLVPEQSKLGTQTDCEEESWPQKALVWHSCASLRAECGLQRGLQEGRGSAGLGFCPEPRPSPGISG